MDKYVSFIENELVDSKNDEFIYEFKKNIYEDMTNRANELTHTGLSDQNVLSDLVISDYADIKEQYKKYLAKKLEHKKNLKFAKYNALGSCIFLLGGVLIFLAISFITGLWGKTWVIVDGAASLWIVYELSILIKMASNSKKKIFHPGARLMLAASVMTMTQFVFFISLVLFSIKKSWLIFIAGVIVMYIADGIYVARSKQRIAILNYLFYILASSPMFYILLAELGFVEWSYGWLVIPMALLVDLIIIALKLISHKKQSLKQEVE